jgi:hypothetical protein
MRNRAQLQRKLESIEKKLPPSLENYPQLTITFCRPNLKVDANGEEFMDQSEDTTADSVLAYGCGGPYRREENETYPDFVERVSKSVAKALRGGGLRQLTIFWPHPEGPEGDDLKWGAVSGAVQ